MMSPATPLCYSLSFQRRKELLKPGVLKHSPSAMRQGDAALSIQHDIGRRGVHPECLCQPPLFVIRIREDKDFRAILDECFDVEPRLLNVSPVEVMISNAGAGGAVATSLFAESIPDELKNSATTVNTPKVIDHMTASLHGLMYK